MTHHFDPNHREGWPHPEDWPRVLPETLEIAMARRFDPNHQEGWPHPEDWPRAVPETLERDWTLDRVAQPALPMRFAKPDLPKPVGASDIHLRTGEDADGRRRPIPGCRRADIEEWFAELLREVPRPLPDRRPGLEEDPDV